MKEKMICAIDFDATLSTYCRPFEFDKFGRPIEEVIKLVRWLYEQGHYIIIFTGRMSTPNLAKWLEKNKVPYHAINQNIKNYIHASRFKPYFSLIIDDKAMNPINLCEGKIKSFSEMKEEAIKILKISSKEGEVI